MFKTEDSECNCVRLMRKNMKIFFASLKSLKKGFGSGSRWSEVRIRILPFSPKCVERTEIMLEKYNFNAQF